jgi:[acyl-carrier-protein] S-malonyltransferase
MDPGGVTSKQIAFVFPGQGSQSVGMGKDLHDSSVAVRRIFQQADEILRFPLSTLCFDGPAGDLEDTINAQPAILTVSLAYLEALKEHWNAQQQTIEPRYVAGHSLGEFSALVAAEALDFSDALRLVRERGRLMKESGECQPGGMAAVIGLDRAVLEQICAESGSDGTVVIANDNCPGQLVISGEQAALERAMELAQQRRARRIVRLDVSIASHSPLMEGVAARFSEVVGRTDLRDPRVPVVANSTGSALMSAEEIRKELTDQMVRPVQWTDSVRRMADAGADTFLEIGPGKVLSGLIRRIRSDVKALTIKESGLIGQ